MNTTVPLESGRELVLQIASFAAGRALYKAIALELLATQIEIEKIDLNLDLAKLDPKALNTLKNVVCRLLASDEVEKAFFACAINSTLNGKKIVRAEFEPEDVREDFLPVAWEVIRFNLAPFVRRIDLSSLTSAAPKSLAPT